MWSEPSRLVAFALIPNRWGSSDGIPRDGPSVYEFVTLTPQQI